MTESSSYLIQGIQEHDIISGQVRLSEVPWYFFSLMNRGQFRLTVCSFFIW